MIQLEAELAQFQERVNGPLTDSFQKRLRAIRDRDGLSYQALGGEIGLSGVFTRHLLVDKANVSTKHIRRIANAVERLEVIGPAAASEKAQERREDLEPMPRDIRHSFNLRLGNVVTFTLPADLTKREADRLAAFIQTLPLDDA